MNLSLALKRANWRQWTRALNKSAIENYHRNLQNISLQRSQWMLRLWLKQLGWAGVTGLSLMAFGLAYYLSAIQPADARIAQLRQQALTLQERIKNAADSFTDNPRSPGGQLNAFYEFFPAADSSSSWLRKIYHAASAQGIVLEQGDYRIAAEKEGRLLHYQVILPVKGSYLQIRKFIAAVLSEIPFASLDQISFEKQKISDPAVEAKIRLTIYLRQST